MPVQSIAKASLQSPAWLLAQAYPQVDKQLAWVDFEPTEWAQGNGISKANTCRERAGAEQGSCSAQFAIACSSPARFRFSAGNTSLIFLVGL